jgi:hypothetical protein
MWSMTLSENRYPLFRVMLCKKEEKRKRNADQRGSVSTASLDAARALQSALANRRSTTALT